MSRRVHWATRGIGALAGLEGDSVVLDRDLLPVTACLRDLEQRTGLVVVAFGGVQSRPGSRAYSVRLARAGASEVTCLLVMDGVRDYIDASPSGGLKVLSARA